MIQDIDVPSRARSSWIFCSVRSVYCRCGSPDRRARGGAGISALPFAGEHAIYRFRFLGHRARTRAAPPGYFNRRIEQVTGKLGGKIGYSDVYYGENEFWNIYNGAAYAALKRRYTRAENSGILTKSACRNCESAAPAQSLCRGLARSAPGDFSLPARRSPMPRASARATLRTSSWKAVSSSSA